MNMTDSFSQKCDNYCENGLLISLILLGLPTLVGLYGCCCMCFSDLRTRIARNRVKKRVVVLENKLSPSFIKTLNSRFKGGITNSECSVCLTEVDVSKKKTVCLSCHHAFHEKCLQEWVKSNVSQDIEPPCPICRKIIVKKRVVNPNYDQQEIHEV